MSAENLVGRYSVDDVGRIYTDAEDLWLPSVSTVIGVRETPEPIVEWQERTDDYKAVMQYKQNRGTIAHAKCLQDLVPTDPKTGDDVEQLWGKDERESKQQLQDSDNWERCQEEVDEILTMWESVKLLNNFDYVHDVETLVCNTQIGYAGQFDLLYEDQQTNETVLADLKTSKAAYDKHLLQLCAYKMAVPLSIDRLEVIRVNPEQSDWRVLPHTEWEYETEMLSERFIELRDELERKQLRTIVETIQDIHSDESDSVDEDGVMYEPM